MPPEDAKASTVVIHESTGKASRPPQNLELNVAFRCVVPDSIDLLRHNPESTMTASVLTSAYVRKGTITDDATSNFVKVAGSAAESSLPSSAVLTVDQTIIRELLDNLDRPGLAGERRDNIRNKIRYILASAAYKSISSALHEVVKKGAEASGASVVVVRHVSANTLNSWKIKSQYTTAIVWDHTIAPTNNNLPRSAGGRVSISSACVDKHSQDENALTNNPVPEEQVLVKQETEGEQSTNEEKPIESPEQLVDSMLPWSEEFATQYSYTDAW